MADFAFLGNDRVSLAFLEKISASFKPAFIITGSDRISGRGRKIVESPLAGFSRKHSLPLYKTDNPNDIDFMNRLPKTDFFIVFSFGYKLSREFLSLPERMPVNIHPSLLPAYRGAAPVNRAIMNGERSTGVTFFKMTERMDSGPVIMQEKITVHEGMTSAELMNTAIETASSMFTAFDWDSGIVMHEQDESKATKAPKINKAELLFNPEDKASVLAHRINGLSEYGLRALFRGKNIKLKKARLINLKAKEPGSIEIRNKSFIISAEDSCLEILSIQPEGKQEMDAFSFINGYKPANGEKICAAYSE